MNCKNINYNGVNIEDIYKLALIGADFTTEKNENGITVIDSLKKELYLKTVLLARFLKVIELPEDRVMSLKQYKDNNYTIESFGGNGIRRLKADYTVFTSMLDEEISNCLVRENDVANRFKEVMSVDMLPENLEAIQNNSKELLSSLKKITKAVEKSESAKTKV